MEKIGLIFPGQGSQYVGMGKEIYHHPEVKAIFDTASDILSYDITKLLFEGPEDILNDTEYAQTSIFTVSIAYFKALPFLSLSDSRLQTPDSRLPLYVAGHSLGEYTALTSAESLYFHEALMIVNKRAGLMKEEASKIKGGMIASLGLSLEKIERICKETNVEIANINSPLQIVISGLDEDLQKAREVVIKEGGKAIRLKTSGPFHSSWMKEAEEQMKLVLKDCKIKPPKIKVIQNVSASCTDNPEIIRENLIKQITGRVRWDETIRFMEKEGITSVIEIGPSNVLSNLTKRITPNIKAIPVSP
ncbi:MAG: ACP S-malonyltransferase [bacterium]